MGFVQKLAKRSDRIKPLSKHERLKNCECKHYFKVKIPKLTWRYVLNLKNWK